MTNWRTTLAGFLLIVGACSTKAGEVLMGGTFTEADFGILATAIVAGLGLIFARDAKNKGDK